MSKSRLFAHFRAEEELHVELLRTAGVTLFRGVVDPAMRAPEGLPRLGALVRRWLGWAARSGLPGGCPLYAAAFELDAADEGPVRSHVMESKKEWARMLEGLVRDAMAPGHRSRNLDATGFLWQLDGIHLSHHVGQRLMRDPEADTRARDALEALVASSLPGRERL